MVDETIKAEECKRYDGVCERCPFYLFDCWLEHDDDIVWHLKYYNKILSEYNRLILMEIEESKPLKWEEFQKMEEKPVWLKDNISGFNGWYIVFGCLKSPKQKLVLYDREDGGILSFELAKMGECGWQAYRKEIK